MGFYENVWEKAKKSGARIVLPEAADERVLRAAESAITRGLVKEIILLGNPVEVRKRASELDLSFSNVNLYDYLHSDEFEPYIEEYYKMRKHKGLSKEDARKYISNPLYFGAMMVKNDKADGMVAGAINSTANVLKPALRIVGPRVKGQTVSSSMVMIVKDRSFGLDGQLIFGDCGIIPRPTDEQLADIAIDSADTAKVLIGLEPVIAMLSFSTKGSAKHESLEKIKKAVEIVRQRRPELIVDGEMQVDAALVEKVARLKCPDSPVKGRANVLIFPDLNAGNISYKLVQRLGNAEAFGPIIQGLAKPVNDLSRGCSVEDIVNVIAVTAVQSAMLNS